MKKNKLFCKECGAPVETLWYMSRRGKMEEIPANMFICPECFHLQRGPPPKPLTEAEKIAFREKFFG